MNTKHPYSIGGYSYTCWHLNFFLINYIAIGELMHKYCMHS